MRIDFDRDDYPTPGSLQRITDRLAEGGNIDELWALLESCLRSAVDGNVYASGGFEMKELRGEPARLFRFSTGGWSGNEHLIDVLFSGLHGGILKSMFLQAWESGGHWYFARRTPL